MSLGNTIKELDACIQRQQSDAAAQLLALNFDNSSSISESEETIDVLCKATFSDGYGEVFAAIFKAKRHIQNKQYVQAYAMQISGFIPFLDIFRDQTNWLVPLLHRLTYDTRILAQHADYELSKKHGVEVTQTLENAEQHLKKGFSMTITDRASPELSKKPGALFIVNQLFRIYFRLNKIGLCGNVIQAINKQNFSQYEKRDQVTYKYYLGRIRMIEDKYKEADECLTFSWIHSNLNYKRNKRMILKYLIPVKLVLGILPSINLLKEYNLEEFQSITLAIKDGNLNEFNNSLLKYQFKFIQQGMYLIMQKLRPLVMRTLLKKIYILRQKIPQVKLIDFKIALEYTGITFDMNELECIVSNMIFNRLVKGFISHKQKILVLSKKNPFPLIRN